VNAVGADVALAHEVVERAPGDGFTVRYLAGPKRGLDIYFFAEAGPRVAVDEQDRELAAEVGAELGASFPKSPGLPYERLVQEGSLAPLTTRTRPVRERRRSLR
jgi:hypothetical protein